MEIGQQREAALRTCEGQLAGGLAEALHLTDRWEDGRHGETAGGGGGGPAERELGHASSEPVRVSVRTPVHGECVRSAWM